LSRPQTCAKLVQLVSNLLEPVLGPEFVGITEPI
jgi:hypothetical protein